MYLGTASATFNSSGIAESIIGPGRARESWTVEQLVTRTTSVTQTQLFVRRYNTSGPRLDYTARGNNDVSPCSYEVPVGQKLSFQWTGGSAGTIATCDIDGERHGV
jgi:hypothetical protein